MRTPSGVRVFGAKLLSIRVDSFLQLFQHYTHISSPNYLELDLGPNYLELDLGPNYLELDLGLNYLELDLGLNYLELD